MRSRTPNGPKKLEGELLVATTNDSRLQVRLKLEKNQVTNSKGAL
jgi:hypothetical protein